tara:strand:+ start:194 stop:1699 length:1506 start_codon:yes stop_codon:yes gene_type:complete
MAYLDRSSRKNGYILHIKSKAEGFDHTLQTGELHRTRARNILDQVNVRLVELKNNQIADADGWTKSQRLEYVKYGKVEALEAQAEAKIETLEEAVDEFIKGHSSSGNALTYIDGLETQLRKDALLFFGGEDGDVPINTITRRRIQDWANHQSKQINQAGKNVGEFRSRATIQQRLKTLKRMFRELWLNREIKSDPEQLFAKIKIPNPPTTSQWDKLYNDGEDGWDTFSGRLMRLNAEGLPVDDAMGWKEIFFSADELAEFISVVRELLEDSKDLNDLRVFGSVMFSAFTGARRSELLRVRRTDIQLDSRKVRLMLRKGETEKKYRIHWMPLHDTLATFLETYLQQIPAEQECIFAENDQHLLASGDFTDTGVRDKANRLGKLLRNVLTGTKFQYVAGFHIYRHTLNSMLVNASGDTDQVMGIIGHKTRRINELYQHADRDQLMIRKSEVISRIVIGKGTTGVQNTVKPAPKIADPMKTKSGRQDLNLRPLHPQCEEDCDDC